MIIKITIPLIVCLFLMTSCLGCGSGWRDNKMEAARLEEMAKQTASLEKIANILGRIESKQLSETSSVEIP